MATLISVYNNTGCIGRCDEKCYDAKEEKCDCICGGVNHGKGKEQAIENAERYADDMLDKFRKQKVEQLAERELRGLRIETSVQLGMPLDLVGKTESEGKP
jgi:hypothetical protein